MPGPSVMDALDIQFVPELVKHAYQTKAYMPCILERRGSTMRDTRIGNGAKDANDVDVIYTQENAVNEVNEWLKRCGGIWNQKQQKWIGSQQPTQRYAHLPTLIYTGHLLPGEPCNGMPPTVRGASCIELAKLLGHYDLIESISTLLSESQNPNKMDNAVHGILGNSFSTDYAKHMLADYGSNGTMPLRNETEPRALVELFAGISPVVKELHNLGAKISDIYVIELDDIAYGLYVKRAKLYYPHAKLHRYKNIKSEEFKYDWSWEGIKRFIALHGAPIIVAGWPCDGVAGANRKADGLDNHKTILAIEMVRLLRDFMDCLALRRA